MTEGLHHSYARFLERPIASVVLPDDPSLTIARVELGLTLYLDGGMSWAQAGAPSVLRAFLAVVPPDHLCWYRTSHMGVWRALDTSAMGELSNMLALPWSASAPRHLFELVLTDDAQCPSCGFRYREIDPARVDRAGVIEITLPQEYDPGYLLPLARAALAAGSLWAGIGGYAIRLGDRFRADAFDVAWAWSQRYAGLDIQDAERMAWRVRTGLPGVNWLTALGSRLAKELVLDLDTVRSHPWIDPMIAVEPIAGNLLVVAGEKPTLGDANWFEDPNAFREVAAFFRDAFVKEPPPFLGRFRDEDGTQNWFRRFL